MRKIAVTALVLIGLSSAGQAADGLILSFSQSFTDNLFQTAFPEKDAVSHLAFSYDKAFTPFSFFTEGQAAFLRNNPYAGSYIQDAGFDYLHPVNAKTAFYASARLGGTLYRSDFADFNHVHVAAMAALKSYRTSQSILNLNATFNYRNYRDSLFDHLSGIVHFSLDRYFDTRTTLKGEARWGYKYFLHPFINDTGGVSTSAGSGQGPGPGSGRMGWRSGFFSPRINGPGQGIRILSLSGLAAQGLGDFVGIRVMAFRQWTLSGENPFVSIEEFYMVENPSHDAFSWNGAGISGLATVEAPWQMQLKIGYTGSEKRFPGIEAMDMEGASLGPMRRDRRTQWDIRLEKSFSAVAVFINFSHIRNVSNDLLFDWKGRYLSAGIDWTLGRGGTK